MDRRSRYVRLAIVIFALAANPAPAQVNLVIDYSLDSNNFFNGQPTRQAALQTAATILSTRLSDTLTAITPGGIDTWTANFTHPGTGAPHSIVDLTIPTNVVRVYAGGRPLGGPLGVGGFGGLNVSGTQNFVDTVVARGQPGALGPAASRTDFGPWGGAITFDTTVTWNFNLAGPVAGQNDFLSVAMHELGHLLGFGTAPSFRNLATAGHAFTGPVSTGLFGSNPPLTIDDGHWAPGVTFGGQQAAMTPVLTVGTRTNFTELDFAGLDDLGWQVIPIPEPATILLYATAMIGAVAWRRRCRAVRVSATPH